MVQFDTDDLQLFLDRSYALVPEGSESARLDLDHDLAVLLREA